MFYTVCMYIAKPKWPSKDGKKIHQSIWLRESYREDGKVKQRNIANLKNCSPEEIEAIELALKHKKDLTKLGSLTQVELNQGPSVGAVWAVSEVAAKLGIKKALGHSHKGKLALWQVIARVLDQGSRLSSVRLAKRYSAAGLLGFKKGFCEDDLYQNLVWLSENQLKIEKRLFTARRGDTKPELFLYDVTSSYLEGDHNELADWGYNRDRKRGKKQIVIGLLCDADGDPVATEVFQGNTSDLDTFRSQIEKTARNFGCERVTMVGDRGMIKSAQISDLTTAGFNYITAITKPQIRSMLKKGIIQLSLFDEEICEVAHDNVRYILRRNPIRAAEIGASRVSRIEKVVAFAEQQNRYLAEHPKADSFKAIQRVWEKESRLKVDDLVKVTATDRVIRAEVNEEYVAELSALDGCYCLKTDLPSEVADTHIVHERYKDLSMVETAFRTMKTAHLEVRPVFVRNEGNTRGHVLVTMLAYLVVRVLKKAWSSFDVTVEEGLDDLKRICAVKLKTGNGGSCLRLPAPDDRSRALLESIEVRLPTVLPESQVIVDTRKKLQSERI